jgi:hypothetical protein
MPAGRADSRNTRSISAATRGPRRLPRRGALGPLRHQVRERLLEFDVGADLALELGERLARAEPSRERRVILARLAQDLGIDVSDAELNASVVQMARSRGQRPDQVRTELQQGGRLNEMALAIREAKTLDRVLAKAKVVDIAAEEWNKLVAEKQKAAAARTAPKKKG